TLIVGTGVIARSHRGDDDAKPAPAAQPPRAAVAPAAANPAPAEVAPPAPAATKAEEPKPKAARKAKEPAAKGPTQLARATRAKAATEAPKAREPEVVAIAPAREGTVNIIALPWAEVFIDGARQGVSPPLKAIPLKSGKHRVELRNGSFPPHVQTVDLRPGAEISVTHRFRR